MIVKSVMANTGFIAPIAKDRWKLVDWAVDEYYLRNTKEAPTTVADDKPSIDHSPFVPQRHHNTVKLWIGQGVPL